MTFSCALFSAFSRSSSALFATFSRFFLDGMNSLPTYSFAPCRWAVDGSDSLTNSKTSASTSDAGLGNGTIIQPLYMFSNLNRTLEYLILPENSTLIPILNMSERVGGTYLAQELPLKLYKKLQKSALK